ncbi:bifunctional 3'-5' exonuclease/DNA polymerase [Agromyces seonyuensis]|nr:bifunctional 3'-5' exonuclease/DNA polymerase [Agromyces seonyuensis]
MDDVHVVLARSAPGFVGLQSVDDAGAAIGDAETVPVERLPAVVAEREQDRPRWIWSDSRTWYPALLDAGVRIERVHDLRAAGAILAGSTFAARARVDHPPSPDWAAALAAEASAPRGVPVAAAGTALFDFDEFDAPAPPAPDAETVVADPVAATVAEFARQQSLVAASDAPGRLRLLLAAESAGTLIGVELQHAGLPWRRDVHESVLERALGPKPSPGRKPAKMAVLAGEVRDALEAPALNLDSQTELLKALQRAGIAVASTSRWELADHAHPAVAPLLAYKKLARLLSANGWTWLDEWIVGGRFRAEYVPGGTATGRWATNGGGALQLPKQVRSAVVADSGWKLVVADAAQLEPRVLAAMARDEAMADAARGRDLYAGLVERGVVASRDEAKIAILGAMYGATSGDAGRLVPRLARAYPAAMALVDGAAREGERGGVVTTLLGRSSPLPPEGWRAVQARASEPGAVAAEERRARSAAREWGRFTRNFVVQGTAAEWALCWMAELRHRLAGIAPSPLGARRAGASGPAFELAPHLVFFLHDELIVHTPAALAPEVADAVAESAEVAGRRLFGTFPVDFPLDLAVVDSYAETD